jgi:Xaa-Pro aminopeptidase
VAFDPTQLTVSQKKDIVKHFSARLLRISKPIVSRLRQLKDKEEIRRIQEAVSAAEDAFREFRRKIKPGMTELEAAAELDYHVRRSGAEAGGFETIVACGGNSAMPHARPGNDRLRAGKCILCDWGARVKGYCSDLTRVVFLGKVPSKFRKIYETVFKAQQAGISAVRSGRDIAEVDRAARSVIERAGYGKYFTHSLGHGIGREVHEPPALHGKSKDKLQPGMILTIEPGIYLPGEGGIRIEDDVLVKEEGAEVLSSLSGRLDDSVLKR